MINIVPNSIQNRLYIKHYICTTSDNNILYSYNHGLFVVLKFIFKVVEMSHNGDTIL